MSLLSRPTRPVAATPAAPRAMPPLAPTRVLESSRTPRQLVLPFPR